MTTSNNITGIKSSTTVLQSRVSSQMKKLLEQFKNHVRSAAEIIIKIYDQGKRDKLNKDEIRSLISSAVGEVMSSRQIRRKLPLELKYVEKIRIGTGTGIGKAKRESADKMSAKKKAEESEPSQEYDDVIRKAFEEKTSESESESESEIDITTKPSESKSYDQQSYTKPEEQEQKQKQVGNETQEIYQIDPKDYDLNDLEKYDKAMLIRIVQYLHQKLELKAKLAIEVTNDITPLEKMQNYCREHNIRSKRQYWEALSKGKIPTGFPQTKRADYTYGVKWNVLLGKTK